MKILAIVGSSRENGNTNYLVDQALAEAGALGAATEKIILGKYNIKPCLGHDNCATFPSCLVKDDMSWILDKLCEADGVILGTPVYVWNVSGQMKTFMDRNFFLYNKNKKVPARAVGLIIVAGGEGIQDAKRALDYFLDGSFDVDKSRRFISTGYASSAGEITANVEAISKARKLGRDMVGSLKGDKVK